MLPCWWKFVFFIHKTIPGFQSKSAEQHSPKQLEKKSFKQFYSFLSLVSLVLCFGLRCDTVLLWSFRNFGWIVPWTNTTWLLIFMKQQPWSGCWTWLQNILYTGFLDNSFTHCVTVHFAQWQMHLMKHFWTKTPNLKVTCGFLGLHLHTHKIKKIIK